MRSQFFLFISLLFLSTISAQVSTSKWQSNPITINGDASDWETMPRFFNSESNVQYEIRNNDQNMYIILRSVNQITQLQMLRGGFSVKLKAKTKEPIKVGITFPPKKEGFNPAMAKGHEQKDDKLVDKFNSNPDLMFKDSAILEGFKFSKGTISSEKENMKGICFAKNEGNREELVFEIQIPLQEIFGNDFQLSEIAKTPIQLLVNINELAQESNHKQKSGDQGGGRGQGGGGGHGGGGHGGGGHGGGGGQGGGGMDEDNSSNSNRQMPERDSMSRKSFKLKFKLSTPN